MNETLTERDKIILALGLSLDQLYDYCDAVNETSGLVSYSVMVALTETLKWVNDLPDEDAKRNYMHRLKSSIEITIMNRPH